MDPHSVPARISQHRAAVAQTLAVLEDLARGIYPGQLERDGVAAALSAAAHSAISVTVSDTTGGRYPREVEAAAYFCCLEAVQNAVKHAHGATRITIQLSAGEQLRFEVRDDGPGFAGEAPSPGLGLTNINDRLASVGGRLTIASRSGLGTRVVGTIPIGR